MSISDKTWGYLKDKTFDLIYNALANDKAYMKDTNRKKMSEKLNYKYIQILKSN